MKLATLFNKLTKNKNKFVNLFILIGIVVLVGVLLKYNNQKTLIQDSMGNNIFANAFFSKDHKSFPAIADSTACFVVLKEVL